MDDAVGRPQYDILASCFFLYTCSGQGHKRTVWFVVPSLHHSGRLTANSEHAHLLLQVPSCRGGCNVAREVATVGCQCNLAVYLETRCNHVYCFVDE